MTNMNLAKLSDDWVPLQIKVFSRWVDAQLNGMPDHHVDDVTKDLSNGVALVQLAKTLTNKDTPRSWVPDPQLSVEQVQNCELALDMFQNDGVKLVGISGKDVNDDNQKLILGLIWSLILHYSVGKSVNDGIDVQDGDKVNEDGGKRKYRNTKDALLSWARERTSNYPNIGKFGAPYDLSLLALLDTYVPEKVNYYSLNPEDSKHNSELATDVMKQLGIPVYVYPEEIEKHDNQVDEKTLLTQLSSAKFVLDKTESRESLLSSNSRLVSPDDADENVDHTSPLDDQNGAMPNKEGSSSNLIDLDPMNGTSALGGDGVNGVNGEDALTNGNPDGINGIDVDMDGVHSRDIADTDNSESAEVDWENMKGEHPNNHNYGLHHRKGQWDILDYNVPPITAKQAEKDLEFMLLSRDMENLEGDEVNVSRDVETGTEEKGGMDYCTKYMFTKEGTW